ncbi:MAG TPA: hypothetical protein VEB41_00570 [Burkholderiales bacterium]|nr:hypothetical protein [Burkholderiales bacterium]
MSGSALLGLILLSMGWLFFLGGLAFNALRRERPLRYWPGVAGSLTVLFSLPLFPRFGLDPGWPWFWVLLPLVLDPGCMPAVAVMAFRRFRGRSTPPSG